MLVGVPKEIKVHEYRVGLTPSSVREMIAHGHQVVVQTDAGTGIGASDDDYRRAGAEIAAGAEEVFRRVDMIVQVVAEDGMTDMTFTVGSADYERAYALLEKIRDDIGFAGIAGAKDVAKVSAIGIGMRWFTAWSHPRPMPRPFDAPSRA